MDSLSRLLQLINRGSHYLYMMLFPALVAIFTVFIYHVLRRNNSRHRHVHDHDKATKAIAPQKLAASSDVISKQGNKDKAIVTVTELTELKISEQTCDQITDPVASLELATSNDGVTKNDGEDEATVAFTESAELSISGEACDQITEPKALQEPAALSNVVTTDRDEDQTTVSLSEPTELKIPVETRDQTIEPAASQELATFTDMQNIDWNKDKTGVSVPVVTEFNIPVKVYDQIRSITLTNYEEVPSKSRRGTTVHKRPTPYRYRFHMFAPLRRSFTIYDEQLDFGNKLPSYRHTYGMNTTNALSAYAKRRRDHEKGPLKRKNYLMSLGRGPQVEADLGYLYFIDEERVIAVEWEKLIEDYRRKAGPDWDREKQDPHEGVVW